MSMGGYSLRDMAFIAPGVFLFSQFFETNFAKGW
jgi:hypothetical protein